MKLFKILFLITMLSSCVIIEKSRYDLTGCYVILPDTVFRIVEELEYNTLAVRDVQNPENGLQYLVPRPDSEVIRVSEKICKLYEAK